MSKPLPTHKQLETLDNLFYIGIDDSKLPPPHYVLYATSIGIDPDRAWHHTHFMSGMPRRDNDRINTNLPSVEDFLL